MELTLCCPQGGDHPVDARLARVAVNERAEPSIEFPCPGCGEYVACQLEEHSALQLIAFGLRAISTRAPAEVAEIHEGPPLAPDDVLDFHLLLGRPDWTALLEHELAAQSQPHAA